MSFSFTPIGVGDAFSAHWYSSCLLLEHEERRLLVDCPHPIRKMLREATARRPAPLDLDSIDAVVLTHLHADHCSGLESMAFFSKFALNRRLRLLAHPLVCERLWEGSLAAGMERLTDGSGRSNEMRFGDYFELIELSFDTAVGEGPFEIECRATEHHIPTTALRVTTPGGSLGYSADTAFDAELIDWLAECDRFIHETNLGTHTAYESLAVLPPDVRERMRLIHFTDDFDQEASAIESLRQGRRYAVEAGL